MKTNPPQSAGNPSGTKFTPEFLGEITEYIATRMANNTENKYISRDAKKKFEMTTEEWDEHFVLTEKGWEVNPDKGKAMVKAEPHQAHAVTVLHKREIKIHDVSIKDRKPEIAYSERLNGFLPSNDIKQGGNECHADLLLAMDKFKPHFVKLKGYEENRIKDKPLEPAQYDIPELEAIKVTGFNIKYDGGAIKSIIIHGQKRIKNIVNNDNTANYKLMTKDPITDDEHLLECITAACKEISAYIKDNKFAPPAQGELDLKAEKKAKGKKK